MIDVLELCTQVLSEAGFSTLRLQDGEPKGVVFENDTIAGFVLSYENAQALVDGWQPQLDAMVLKHQFGLRRAGDRLEHLRCSYCCSNCDHAGVPSFWGRSKRVSSGRAKSRTLA